MNDGLSLIPESNLNPDMTKLVFPFHDEHSPGVSEGLPELEVLLHRFPKFLPYLSFVHNNYYQMYCKKKKKKQNVTINHIAQLPPTLTHL